MSPFDQTSQRRGQGAPHARESVRTDLLEDVVQSTQANLARGIVWADILADIAADEEARRPHGLPDAA